MTVCRFLSPLLLISLLTLTGCSLVQTDTVLYQLDGGALAEPAAKGSNLAVQLEPIVVADYLKAEHLVQRQSDNSLVIVRHARWAGPLGDNLSEQLLRQLSGRLKTDKLVQAPVPAGFKSDLLVRLDVTRFDAGPALPAVLEARWRLLDANGELRGTRLVRLSEPHLGGIADQVRAQNLLVRRLAEELAVAINAQPVAQKPQASARPAPAAVPERSKPRPPMPIPIRTDVEVFRF